LKIQESITARQSWNEALKLKIKTQENLSAEALSEIADKIKQRGERLDELLRQLTTKNLNARRFQGTTKKPLLILPLPTRRSPMLQRRRKT
jgi:hypothetical protein